MLITGDSLSRLPGLTGGSPKISVLARYGAPQMLDIGPKPDVPPRIDLAVENSRKRSAGMAPLVRLKARALKQAVRVLRRSTRTLGVPGGGRGVY